MKILCLADEADKRLWDNLDRRLLEGVDLVLACGDLPSHYLSFLTCFTNAPILYVHGNHDDRYEQDPPEGCFCIDDTVYNFNGLRIAGLGGSMRYKPGPHQYSEREMQKRIFKLWWKLRKGVDIVIAHAPVRGVGDGSDRPHYGFEAFQKLIRRYKPRYFIHGHIHKNYTFDFKREREFEGTKVINAWKSYFIEL